jgi:hypothetical protein
VRYVWERHGLETMRKRLEALGTKMPNQDLGSKAEFVVGNAHDLERTAKANPISLTFHIWQTQKWISVC